MRSLMSFVFIAISATTAVDSKCLPYVTCSVFIVGCLILVSVLSGWHNTPNHCWYQQTRVFLLPHSEYHMILSSFVCVQYQHVTDGQTDGIAVANTAFCIESNASAL